MLCRNRVQDFDVWKAFVSSHAEAHRTAGLELERMWRAVDDPNNVFFLFRIESIEKANAFINDPESAKAGEVSGVIDGEYHFVDDAGGY